MGKFTRVRDKATGHHYSVRVVDEARHQVLKRPAEDVNGRALPAKPRAESARSTTQPADTTANTDEEKS